MTKAGMRRFDWIRSVLNRLYNSSLEERKYFWEKEQKSVSPVRPDEGFDGEARTRP